MSKQNVEQLLEKWISAFKAYGGYIEVFVNPTAKELRSLGNTYRWIADAKNKKLYAWGVGSLHMDGWKSIKKETNDTRLLYKSGDLLTGVMENGTPKTESMGGVHIKYRKQLVEQDWSFVEKYFDINQVIRTIPV